ncbi:neural proliferation differentiation and control protein 1-like isoform X1 [Asterias amurensis]|uniref:neural proliferation differentiation and control protein 1-like isoform X1 n=1 Tax=Asterias amurensis TaxID=7602 RepID=UPI003AB4CFEA
MTGKIVSVTSLAYVIMLHHLLFFLVGNVSGEVAAGTICPSIQTCTNQRRSECTKASRGCGPCIHPYIEHDGICKYNGQGSKRSNEREEIPEIDLIVKRVEQTRRSNGGSTQTSTKGEVVVDKTETRVKTDHQIVEPNGETTHLEHENVDTVEKTKPASDPVEASREEVVPVGGAAPAADPVEVAEDPAPQGEVDAAVRNDNDDLLQADADPGEVDKQQGSPFAHDGEILLEDWQFILIVCGCVAVGVLGIAVAFLCWYKIQTTAKAQSEAEYPAYGLTGPSAHTPSNMSSGDRKLAQSAQMYHYQHQKQQMIAMEKREKGEMQHDASDYDSEEENEDGDLTVYECPGLAPTGEMQVKNPLFTEDRNSEAVPEPEEKQ